MDGRRRRGAARRRAAAWTAVAATVVSATACGGADDELPGGHTWVVALSHAEGDWRGCLDTSGTAVVEEWGTADLPSSSWAVRLAPRTTRDTAEALVACIEGELTGGTVTLDDGGTWTGSP
ncbi:hypothetical protein [Cellulosimicrobium protaetiae]|uniref:Uncharacterized protein n=1 Tax=Cellulosimicrobium protaetiae TaxID=2587808 RepID=A0A6M5UEJ7_9MICO|nr:hypothetical protein [Cellulosimicrobium protaetiae]QJW35518.1 hypothetical protein FIC82_004185 [Cellulosimicrobium protaetiae]